MLLLRKNSAILMVLFLVAGCVTSNYKVIKQTDSLTEVLASADRVFVKCEHQDGYDGDVKEPYGFMMLVLDEEKTILTLILPSVIEKKDCFEHTAAINKILKHSKAVRIGSFSPLPSQREKTGDNYDLPKLGTFEGNGRILNYQVIWNDNGQCYDAQSGTKKPCPRNEFKAY